MSEQIDIKQLPDALMSFGRACSRALVNASNVVAFRARQAVLDEASRRFKLRNKWVPAMIRYEKATDDHPEASVYTTSKELKGQELGETRRDSGDFRVPVDVYDVFGLDKGKVIPKQYRAGQLLQKGAVKGVSVYVAKTKAGHDAVFGKDSKGTHLLWALAPELMIPRRPFFFDPVKRTIDRDLVPEYNKALDKQLEQKLL